MATNPNNPKIVWHTHPLELSGSGRSYTLLTCFGYFRCDPSVGRFGRLDPLRECYAYAGDDPINFVDPSELAFDPAVPQFGIPAVAMGHHLVRLIRLPVERRKPGLQPPQSAYSSPTKSRLARRAVGEGFAR